VAKLSSVGRAKRVALAVVASVASFLIFSVPWSGPKGQIEIFVIDSVMKMSQSGDYPAWFLKTVARVGLAVEWIPLLLVSLGVFYLCTRGTRPDGYLRCLKCRYILKGLSEPRCPECGTPI